MYTFMHFLIFFFLNQISKLELDLCLCLLNLNDSDHSSVYMGAPSPTSLFSLPTTPDVSAQDSTSSRGKTTRG